MAVTTVKGSSVTTYRVTEESDGEQKMKGMLWTVSKKWQHLVTNDVSEEADPSETWLCMLRQLVYCLQGFLINKVEHWESPLWYPNWLFRATISN